MLSIVAHHLKDVSVLRRLLFAASHLPREVPNFWGYAVEFATAGKVDRNSIDTDTAAALIENIQSFDGRAFETDESLIRQLIGWTPSAGRPLGIVLISPQVDCPQCGHTLTLRKDRPSSIVVYDENLGSVPCRLTFSQNVHKQTVYTDPVLWLLHHWDPDFASFL